MRVFDISRHCRNSRVSEANKPSRSYGFTLIEVLVALAIVAIALTAGVRATASLSNNAQRQSDVFLGQICAENQLNKVRMSTQMPNVGDSVETCEQAGRIYNVAISVRPTPNPNFRRVDAKVLDGNSPIVQVTTIVSRF